jgi:hypothetical protein
VVSEAALGVKGSLVGLFHCACDLELDFDLAPSGLAHPDSRPEGGVLVGVSLSVTPDLGVGVSPGLSVA